jgi:hypothetical protein
MAFIVECIQPDPPDEHGRILHQHCVVGPFETFEEAHNWMMAIGTHRFDTCIIHHLRDWKTSWRSHKDRTKS